MFSSHSSSSSWSIDSQTSFTFSTPNIPPSLTSPFIFLTASPSVSLWIFLPPSTPLVVNLSFAGVTQSSYFVKHSKNMYCFIYILFINQLFCFFLYLISSSHVATNFTLLIFLKRATRCTKAPAYARSGKGSHHFWCIVRSLTLFFTQEVVSKT